MGAFVALVGKDLQIFFGDRRSVILTLAVPIAIASFFGAIFSGAGGGGASEAAKIPVMVVDDDRSAISKSIVAGMEKDSALKISTVPLDQARAAVQSGTTAVAVVIPPGFGEAAGRAFLAAAQRPEIGLLFDPSRTAEVSMIRGMLTGHVMEAVGQEMFSGVQGRALVDEALANIGAINLPADQRETLRSLLQSVQRFNQTNGVTGTQGLMTVPYTVNENAVTSRANVAYNSYAHSFAGMGIQFLLFAGIDLGTGILLERERGLWKRFRSAPVSRFAMLGARAMSGTLLTLLTLLVSFGFAMVVFGVRIEGSIAGFALVALACSIMAATFGLLVSALGRTAAATRRVAGLAVLIMVMLGGAWVPSFIFPAWLQTVTVVIPARWAVDGLDAMTWRGLGLQAALLPTFVMLLFSLVFGALTLWKFRWEEA